MPVNPEIALQVQPLKLPDPLESAGKAISLKHLLLQNAEAEDQLSQQRSLRSLMSGADPNDPKATSAALLKGGFGREAMAWDKASQENEKAALETEKARLDGISRHFTLASQAYGSLGPNPTVDQIMRTDAYLKSQGMKTDISDAPKSQEEVPAWIQKVVARGQSVGEQLTAAQQQWERNYKEFQQRWEMSKPQSEYGKVFADTQRMEDPAFRSFDVGRVKLNAMGPGGLANFAPSTNTQPPRLASLAPQSVDATSGAIVKPAGGAGGMPVTSQELDPTTLQPVEQNPSQSAGGVQDSTNSLALKSPGSVSDDSLLARWHARGGKAPEGTVPYVEGGDVKFKVDPAWLQAKTAVAKAGAANINAAGGDIALGKQAATKVDEGLLDTTARIMRLDRIQNQYKPEFQQTMPRLSNAWTAIKERAGVDVSTADQQKLAEFSQYKRTSIENLNQYIKETTGAAMSEAEAVRLRQAMPDPGDSWYNGDSPTQFKSKMDDVVRSLKMAEARLVHIKRNGLSMESIPLEKMPEIINQRGAQLEKQLAKSGTDKEEIESVVRRQLAQEFGLVYK